MRFVSQVDEFVKTVERNVSRYFPSSTTTNPTESTDEVDGGGPSDPVDAAGDVEGLEIDQQESGQPVLLRKEHQQVNEEITKSASEFKRQSHFLVVMLTAMQKHGASPHVTEILTQLNFNYFYHQQEQHLAPAFTRTAPSSHSARPRLPVRSSSLKSVQATGLPRHRSGSTAEM